MEPLQPGRRVLHSSHAGNQTSIQLYRLCIPNNTCGYKTIINVTLLPKSESLEEVVVVGYGVQKKANLTGSVSTVNFDQEMSSRPIANASSAMAGLSAGVQVQQSSGKPGSNGATIRIRGTGTLNSNNPLVLVDGIEWDYE